MAIYFPIKCEAEMKSSQSDMVALNWRWRALVADFTTADAFSYVRVIFNRAEIVRALDEMPISTEEDRKNEGLIPDHFSYRVEESHFWETLSPSFRFVHKSAQHYRFITGNTCLDVISHKPPRLIVVPADTRPTEISNGTIWKNET